MLDLSNPYAVAWFQQVIDCLLTIAEIGYAHHTATTHETALARPQSV